MTDLMMYQGQIEANAARERGDIWGNAISQAGQALAGGIQQHQEEKKKKSRDSAWLAVINDPERMKDPRALFAESNRIWGPEDGPKMFQGVVGAYQLMQPKRNPEADQKALSVMGSAYLRMKPEGRAATYGQVRQTITNAFPDFGKQMPEQYDPAFDESVVVPFVQSMQPEEAAYTLSPGEKRMRGNEVIGEAPALPKEPKRYPVTTTGPDGRPLQRLATEEEMAAGVPAYREPKAAPKPDIERIETVDADGKPVTQFVTPTVGATYAKPTGAAKPATGQQKKALNFFNRAREAQEIASALEQGNKIDPATIQYMPEVGNFLLDDSNQAYIQAQRAFTEARLRKESGAAVPKHEYENDAETYFARQGDSDATKAQKKAGRDAILAGIAFESGDALREFYGDEAEGMIAGYRAASRGRGTTQASEPPRVTSRAEYDAVPSGAVYLTPDGRRKRKR